MSQWGNRGIGSPAGGRLPFILWCSPPALSTGTAAQVTHDLTVARLFNRTYKEGYTVTRIICGVDVASTSLSARIGREGTQASFANSPQGIAELAVFCHQHQV